MRESERRDFESGIHALELPDIELGIPAHEQPGLHVPDMEVDGERRKKDLPVMTVKGYLTSKTKERNWTVVSFNAEKMNSPWFWFFAPLAQNYVSFAYSVPVFFRRK